jgi:hypothetical protein
MNPTEKRAIRKVIKRLRPEPQEASAKVVEALNGPASLYLDTWVIAVLELLAKDGRTLGELKLAAEL